MSLFSWARAGMDAVDDDDDEEEEGGKHPDGMSAPSSPGVDWSLPPEGEEGGPIAVSVCLEAHHVTAVDTVKATAVIKCGVVLYWRDRRLSEMWSSGDDGACRAGRFTLPGKLWGPRLRLHNALDVRVDQVFFDLVRPAEGLLRRMLVYTGTIINSMDLRDFPFDIDEVEVLFRTSSDYATRDGKDWGASVAEETYKLRWLATAPSGAPLPPDVARRPGDTERRLRMLWDGSLHEWSLRAVTTSLNEAGTQAAAPSATAIGSGWIPMAASALDDSCAVAEGAPTEASTLSVVPRMAPAGSRTDGHSAFVYTPTTISLTFHICRASGYYLLRAVLPMAIVGAFGLCSLLMEADELAARLSLTLSAFVANVTLVFVIAAFLPKLSHLTAIDRLVTVTMCAIGATALAAVAADLAMQARGPEAGHACDRVARRVIPAFYAAAALATILVPAIRNHRARRLLFADYRDPLGGAGGQLTFVHTHTAEAVHVWNAVASRPRYRELRARGLHNVEWANGHKTELTRLMRERRLRMDADAEAQRRARTRKPGWGSSPPVVAGGAMAMKSPPG